MELSNLDTKMNQYISNELTGKALLEFEQLLSENNELAKEVALYKKIDQTLMAKKSTQNKEELKTLFKQFGSKYISNPIEKETPAKVFELEKEETLYKAKTNKGVLRWLVPVIGVAAAAAFLIFFIGLGETGPQQLAQQYFEPYIFEATFRNDRADNLTLAQQAYDKKEYQKALNLLNEYPNNTSALMAKGNCEFLLDEYEKAIETFKQLSNKKIDVHQKAKAQWYLALSYLKLEKVNEAKKSLQLFTKDSNYYSRAQTILKKLD